MIPYKSYDLLRICNHWYKDLSGGCFVLSDERFINKSHNQDILKNV